MIIIIPPPSALLTAIAWSPIVFVGLVLAICIIAAPIGWVVAGVDWAVDWVAARMSSRWRAQAKRWSDFVYRYFHIDRFGLMCYLTLTLTIAVWSVVDLVAGGI